MTDKLREELAAHMHEALVRWLQYLFSKTNPRLLSDATMSVSDGGVNIPSELARKWICQTWKSYDGLSEKEKEDSRTEADKILEIFQEYMSSPFDDELLKRWHKVMEALEALYREWYKSRDEWEGIDVLMEAYSSWLEWKESECLTI